MQVDLQPQRPFLCGCFAFTAAALGMAIGTEFILRSILHSFWACPPIVFHRKVHVENLEIGKSLFETIGREAKAICSNDLQTVDIDPVLGDLMYRCDVSGENGLRELILQHALKTDLAARPYLMAKEINRDSACISRVFLNSKYGDLPHVHSQTILGEHRKITKDMLTVTFLDPNSVDPLQSLMEILEESTRAEELAAQVAAITNSAKNSTSSNAV